MAINPKWDVPAGELGRVVRALIEQASEGVIRCTSYVSPKQTVKATFVTFDGRLPDRRASRADVRLTVGAPNYAERRFIKICEKAGEPFPVKKLQLKVRTKK